MDCGESGHSGSREMGGSGRGGSGRAVAVSGGRYGWTGERLKKYTFKILFTYIKKYMKCYCGLRFSITVQSKLYLLKKYLPILIGFLTQPNKLNLGHGYIFKVIFHAGFLEVQVRIYYPTHHLSKP